MSDLNGMTRDELAQQVLATQARTAELVMASANFAKMIMVERYPREDIATGAAYERLRKAIEALS